MRENPIDVQSALLSPDEVAAYRLRFYTPGLSVREIAAKIGKNPGHASRILASAQRKVSEIQAIAKDAGADLSAVDRYIHRAVGTGQN